MSALRLPSRESRQPSPEPEAWVAALSVTGTARHVLFAKLALRLAQLGRVSEVRFTVTDGTPLETIRSALAALAASGGTATDARLGAHEAIGEEPPDPEPAPRSAPEIALDPLPEACVKRTKACLICGTVFEVNFRHADKHRFCSSACRSRHRRTEAGRSSPRSMREWRPLK